MVPQLLQPPCHVLVGLVLTDIVHKESSNSATIVCRCDGPVTLLPGGIPDLSFDGLGVDLDGAGSEFNADGGL